MADKNTTGVKTQAYVNSLVNPTKARKELKKIEPKGALPAQKGRADWDDKTRPQLTAGIASPLTETDYNQRQHWAEKTVSSSDGLLSFRIKPIKQFTQADANNGEVVQVFAQPVAPTP